jgi:hypothetical protein
MPEYRKLSGERAVTVVGLVAGARGSRSYGRILKAECEVRTGKTPGPSDIAEERMHPCGVRWGHGLNE